MMTCAGALRPSVALRLRMAERSALVLGRHCHGPHALPRAGACCRLEARCDSGRAVRVKRYVAPRPRLLVASLLAAVLAVAGTASMGRR